MNKPDLLAVKCGNNELWKLLAIRTNHRLWRSIHITTAHMQQSIYHSSYNLHHVMYYRNVNPPTWMTSRHILISSLSFYLADKHDWFYWVRSISFNVVFLLCGVVFLGSYYSILCCVTLLPYCLFAVIVVAFTYSGQINDDADDENWEISQIYQTAFFQSSHHKHML